MCALKVSLSTGKGKGVPKADRHPSADRGVRLLRLTAALSIIIAVVAVVAVVRGDLSCKSQALIVAAVVLGTCALVGMAVLTLPYAYRRKDRK